MPGSVSQATGTFQDVSSGITEQGYPGGSGSLTANAFSLQLNSQFFTGSVACNGSGDPTGCEAWQQFVYTYENSSTSYVFMQYWLINYDATCPSGWYTSGTDCYTNSNAANVSTLTASQLATVQLTGTAASGGTDGVALSVGAGQATSVTNSDSKVGLAGHWNTTEWGVYGDGGGSEAYFGAGTTLQAQTALTATTSAAPSCVAEGFTGETNNLTLTSTPALGSEPSPTMASRQTDGTTGTANCSAAPGSPASTLLAGQELTGGHDLTNGKMAFALGTDGNLVLTDAGHAVWANGETGHSGAYLIMQTDGNLVEYYGGTAIWSSGTYGHPGAYLALYDYGEPSVISGDGQELWRTPYPNTYFSPSQQDVLFPGQELLPGQTMYDASSSYSMYIYQGYLEEYRNNTQDLLWYAGSSCSGTYYAIMQTDGNFVIYCNGKATWDSNTVEPSSYGLYLHLQADGNVVVYSNYGRSYWANGQ